MNGNKNALGDIRMVGLLKLVLLFALFTSVFSNAQVTTNSGSGLAPVYPTLATAVTALNAAVITSPVSITLTGNETAPAGGYRITAQGTAANPIIIQGFTSTITANASLTVGALNDAIFKLVGADYVTIRNFTMLEDAGNIVVSPAAANRMTEWGVALLYATATNGAQNNTIQSNTISLNRTYRNSFGIYSNSTHAETTVTTSATATSAAGSNTGLSILSNTISNVNLGITVVGPTASADHNQSLTIGGSGFGNTITNFGTDVPLSSYANVSGTGYGILVRNTANFTVSDNTITSSVGGYLPVASSSLRGIYVPTRSVTTDAPIGALTQVIDRNTISLQPGVASTTIQGISVENNTGNATASLSISNNDFNNTGHTVAGTAGITFISNVMGNPDESMNFNTFTNLTVNTTGIVTFINHNALRPANAICNVNNNAIVGTFNKTGSGGLVYFYNSNPSAILSSPASVTDINTGNNFSNITVTGTTIIQGWRNIDGSASGTTFPYGPTKTVSNNTFTNIAGGTGQIEILVVQGANASAVNMVGNNTISNVSGAGVVRGIVCFLFGSQRFENNTINGLSTSGAFAVTGINLVNNTAADCILDAFKNKIYNLQATHAGGSVVGIYTSTPGTANVQNNIIGDLRVPNADGANPLIGITIGAGAGTVNVSHNTVLLSGGSTGTVFGSSAIFAESIATLVLRNNILVNKSIPNGGGFATAYRRSTTDLSTYGAASNNNLFFGSTIFTDGINTDATLTAYKARVTSRDAVSVTEDPAFITTAGATADFLHIDTTIPTLIESRATPIAGIADDFDGDARNVSMPDIGSDEFSGTCSLTSNTATASACDNYTWAVNGTVYTVSGTYNHVAGCHTETLNLTVTATPAMPTGLSNQAMNAGDTMEDIVVSGAGIVWYPTAIDGANGTNPIAAGTLLVDGTTYYAVAENGTCRSAALAVTVSVALGTGDFETSKFRYYPNPVSSVLTIESISGLKNVSICNMLGQQLLSKKVTEAFIQLDMSGLSAGTYFVKMNSNNASKTLKVVKQ